MSSRTVTLATNCQHCGEPVPVNGPAQSARCPHCNEDVTVPVDVVVGVLTAGDHALVIAGGASFRAVAFSDPSPECPRCGQPVTIAPYLGKRGATTTLPCAGCGADVPTYPAPAWLRKQLPTAVQVFGGDAHVTKAAGIELRVDESAPAPVAMACPSCGGGLTMTSETARTVPCTFCKATVFLPDELWSRLHPVKAPLRWTLTYTGKLETKAEIGARRAEVDARHAERTARDEALLAKKQARQERGREAAHEIRSAQGVGKKVAARIKEDVAFALSTGKSKPRLIDRIINGWALAATFVPLIAFPVVWYLTRTKVQGTVSASGHLMGTWSSSVDSCQRDDGSALGVDLFSGGNELMSVADSQLTGLSVSVTEGPTSKRLRRWDSHDCKVLKGSVTIDHSSSTNGVSPADGSIDFDCTADVNGSPEHVVGHVTFKNCS